MSYVYSRRGSNYGLGAILADTRAIRTVAAEPTREPISVVTAEPIREPVSIVVPQYVMADPMPAPPTLELRPDVPMTVTQSSYVVERIVAGPAPTVASTLSQVDVPTYIEPRSILSAPPVAVQTAQAEATLRQALYQPPAVDVKYSDASLFTDVPIRPTIPMVENPTVIASQPPREIPSNYVEDVARATTLQPVQPVAPIEPVVSASGAVPAGVIVQSSVIAPSSNYVTITPAQTPVSKTDDRLAYPQETPVTYVEPDPDTRIFPTEAPSGSRVSAEDLAPEDVPTEPSDTPTTCEANYVYDQAAGLCVPQPSASPPSPLAPPSLPSPIPETGAVPLVAGAALLAYLLLR